jgi:hypothetical protein
VRATTDIWWENAPDNSSSIEKERPTKNKNLVNRKVSFELLFLKKPTGWLFSTCGAL